MSTWIWGRVTQPAWEQAGRPTDWLTAWWVFALRAAQVNCQSWVIYLRPAFDRTLCLWRPNQKYDKTGDERKEHSREAREAPWCWSTGDQDRPGEGQLKKPCFRSCEIWSRTSSLQHLGVSFFPPLFSNEPKEPGSLPHPHQTKRDKWNQSFITLKASYFAAALTCTLASSHHTVITQKSLPWIQTSQCNSPLHNKPPPHPHLMWGWSWSCRLCGCFLSLFRR